MEKAKLQTLSHPCPELGAQEDLSISCTYPSIQNTCFHCQKLAKPSLAHQTEFCLQQAYVNCPVYALPVEMAFPAQFRHIPEDAPRRTAQTMLIFVLVAALGLLLWLEWGAVARFLQAPPTPAINAAMLQRPTHMPVLNATPTLPKNTRRPRPTLTSTVTATVTVTSTSLTVTRGLDVPFSVGDDKFIIHRILEGESLELIARKYTTTESVIRKINVFVPTPVWAGSVILISPGMQAVNPALPAFEPYQVPDAAITLAELALRLKVDPALLQYYTLCANPCRFDANDWLIIPRLR